MKAHYIGIATLTVSMVFGLFCTRNGSSIRSGQCLEGNCNNGIGKKSMADGSTYWGSFESGLPEGVGILETAAGDEYQTDWKAGKMDGPLTIKYVNGDEFLGHAKQGELDGEGTYTYKNGTNFTGHWVAGRKEGKITTYAHVRNSIERGFCIYANDVPISGQCYVCTANGDCYWGPMKDGLREGFGFVFDRAGKIVQVGSWERGHFLR